MGRIRRPTNVLLGAKYVKSGTQASFAEFDHDAPKPAIAIAMLGHVFEPAMHLCDDVHHNLNITCYEASLLHFTSHACAPTIKTNKEAPSLTACKWTFGSHHPFCFQIRNDKLGRHKTCYHPFRDMSPEYHLAQASNYAVAHPMFPLRIRLPCLHHQPTVLLDAPAHFLRLSSDQQISRFASRGKLVLKAWDANSLAKIPLEKVAEPAREGALDQQFPRREVCNRPRGRYYIICTI